MYKARWHLYQLHELPIINFTFPYSIIAIYCNNFIHDCSNFVLFSSGSKFKTSRNYGLGCITGVRQVSGNECYPLGTLVKFTWSQPHVSMHVWCMMHGYLWFTLKHKGPIMCNLWMRKLDVLILEIGILCIDDFQSDQQNINSIVLFQFGFKSIGIVVLQYKVIHYQKKVQCYE